MARGKIVIVNGAKQMLKVVREKMKEALAETGEFWHENFLPDHFEEGAARKYNYKPRSLNHRKRKRKKFGHSKPLVFTGEMERQVKQRAIIKSTKKKATVSMTGPRYLFQFRKDFDQPDKADELTRLTPREEQKLNKVLGDAITDRIRKNKTKQTIRV